jgi:hypothetical protein
MKRSLKLSWYIFFLISTTLFSCSEIMEKTEPPGEGDISTRSSSYTDYYWYNGTKVGLNKKKDKKFILFEASDEQAVALSITNAKTIAQPQEVILSPKIQGSKAKPSSELLKWAVIETSLSFASSPNILYEAPYFLTENGDELGLSHLFYVRLRDKEDLAKLTELASSNKVEIIGNNEYMPLWFTLACSKESTGNALDLANKFYETNLFEACQPNLMGDFGVTCVNDTYFSSQWNLSNTGQNGGTPGIDIKYCDVRSVTQGSSSIIVAMVDQGIQLDHPDLNVYPTSYDTETGTSPSVVRGNHATSCAGIAGARANNNLGVAGIAPNCPLMSISNNLVIAPDVTQKLADGINFAWRHGASVISNSWYSPYQDALLTDAINAALSGGRSGRGSIVVFSAGNDNRNSVSYPANSIADILAVGAMSPCAERKNPSSCDGENWWGSNYGSALDVVAPGVFIPTTDRTGSAGYGGEDYYLTFNGTSAAAPHVAATAALILSQNSNLTQKEVANVIESTARKVGNYSYTTTYGRPNGTWNEQMGYGLLDALSAVLGADCQTTSIQGITYTSSTTVAGCYIQAVDITVSNNSKLTLVASKRIEISPSLNVNNGSTFEMAVN